MDQPQLETYPPPRVGRTIWITLLLLAVGGGTFALMTRDDRAPAGPSELAGRLWTARQGDRTALYFLTAREWSETRWRGPGQRDELYRVHFYIVHLRARDARDGAPLGDVEIFRVDNSMAGRAPEILGAAGDALWIWNSGLEARDRKTLQQVCSPARLKEANPQLFAHLPNERKHCNVLGDPPALTVLGRDARYYRIDVQTARMEPIDEGEIARLHPSGTAQAAFHELKPAGKATMSTSAGGYTWNSLTQADTWFALLSDEERARLTAHPGEGTRPWGDVARRLHRAPFEWEDRPLLGHKVVKLNPEVVQPVGAERLLMAGFLLRPEGGGLWTIDDGATYYALHREAIGETAAWQVSRLGLDGKIRWTATTGLTDLEDYGAGDGTMVFAGKLANSAGKLPTPEGGMLIDLESGQSRPLDLFEP